MENFKSEASKANGPDRELLVGGTKPKNDRLDVLKLKLQGKSPEQIADMLEMRIADVFKHDRAIKQSMKKENEVELSKMDATQLEAMADTLSGMLPYMEKSTRAIAKTAKSVKPLYGDMVENAELLHSLLHKALLIELEQEDVDLKKVSTLNGILNESYKAFFNKEGIQIVNVLNDNSVNLAAQQKAESLEALKKMAGVADDAIDVDVE